ncbi:uncharacterized protein LOC135400130 isoform X1 [Ornithodoros turicata]|uniref:uncharacterized protein LOC135400130 isoform X1 n=1 Tax=Ornithodoros turicata TaxID=34597 RepID=UPI003139ACB0
MPAKRELLFRLVIADAGKMKVILVSGIFVAVATCYPERKSDAYTSDDNSSPSGLVIAAADDEDYGEVRPPPLHNPDSCDAEYCGSICRQYACSRFRFCRGGRCTPRHTLPCLCIH